LPEKSKQQLTEALELLDEILDSENVRFTRKMKQNLEKLEMLIFSLVHDSENTKDVS